MRDKSNVKNREQYAANRKKLIELSKRARALIDEGEADTVNEALLLIYAGNSEEIPEFNTFGQWKQQGYTIKKGARAYLVWGQPRQVEQTPEGSEEPEQYKYWPLCYLFSENQVVKPVPVKQAPKQEPQRKPAEPIEMDAILN